ncbi:uncharacterized protein B0H64DRAFT_225883 [Chaetomium fimeti]|uniref:Uncharacterized protein n=1 Tax=Chaetomium fimeti TaxID=1854472 RepID=A0AAE0H9D5_9PEZI|nr:hypothetical protein B0H64DRAFT_225883 [Chaetomium fimeti]
MRCDDRGRFALLVTFVASQPTIKHHLQNSNGGATVLHVCASPTAGLHLASLQLIPRVSCWVGERVSSFFHYHYHTAKYIQEVYLPSAAAAATTLAWYRAAVVSPVPEPGGVETPPGRSPAPVSLVGWLAHDFLASERVNLFWSGLDPIESLLCFALLCAEWSARESGCRPGGGGWVGVCVCRRPHTPAPPAHAWRARQILFLRLFCFGVWFRFWRVVFGV